MGQSRWIDDDEIQRKLTPSFPGHESIVARNAKKQRRWKIIDTLLCRWRYDWNSFSHTYFCSSAQYLRSSLRCVGGIQYLSSKNGEARVGRTIWPIVRASQIIDNDTQTFDWNACTRKFIAKYKERVKRLPQQDRVIECCTDAGFLTMVEVGQYFMTNHNLQNQWRVVSTLCHEMKNQLARKVGFEGTPKLDPCWKSQPGTWEVKKEWTLELNLSTKTSLTRKSFSWIEQVGHRLDRQRVRRQRAGDLWNEDGNICVEDGNICFLQADQRLKQNHEDLPLLAHLQELYPFVKDYGLTLNQELNSIKRTQWQKG